MAVLRRIVEEARKKFGQDEKGMDTFLGFSYAPHGKSAAPVWRKEVLCLSCEVPMLMTLKSAVRLLLFLPTLESELELMLY